MWDLWWTKWHWSRFSPSTSVSPVSHSTKFSVLIFTRGRYNRPTGGRHAEWTQLDSALHYSNKKKLETPQSDLTTFGVAAFSFMINVILCCHCSVHEPRLVITVGTPECRLKEGVLKTHFIHLTLIMFIYVCSKGHAVAWLIEAVCHKPESRGFDSRCYCIFRLT
jgi:hypothetical protein